jgi:prophage tail gpP-like protein
MSLHTSHTITERIDAGRQGFASKRSGLNTNYLLSSRHAQLVRASTALEKSKTKAEQNKKQKKTSTAKKQKQKKRPQPQTPF